MTNIDVNYVIKLTELIRTIKQLFIIISDFAYLSALNTIENVIFAVKQFWCNGSERFTKEFREIAILNHTTFTILVVSISLICQFQEVIFTVNRLFLFTNRIGRFMGNCNTKLHIVYYTFHFDFAYLPILRTNFQHVIFDSGFFIIVRLMEEFRRIEKLKRSIVIVGVTCCMHRIFDAINSNE